jgi:hypothetical protein
MECISAYVPQHLGADVQVLSVPKSKDSTSPSKSFLNPSIQANIYSERFLARISRRALQNKKIRAVSIDGTLVETRGDVTLYIKVKD